MSGILIQLFSFVSFILYLRVTYCFECNLALHNSNVLGLGVYADKNVEPGDTVETSIGIPIPIPSVYWTELVNYAEGYNETHALILLGNAMLFNHVEDPDHEMIRKYMTYQDGMLQFRETFQRSADIIFVAKRYIYQGEQIFLHYGNDWFENRAKVAEDVTSLAAEQMHVIPGCPQELTQLRGNKLVATRFIPKGEIIEISRAILLPHWSIVEDSPLVDLLWWKPTEYSRNAPTFCSILDKNKFDRDIIGESLGSAHAVSTWNQSTAEYAVILTGNGALYSHSTEIVISDSNDTQLDGSFTDDISSIGDMSISKGENIGQLSNTLKEPNVQYEWWQGSEDSAALSCELLMLVSFTAVRDIAANEELVVDLVLDKRTNMRFPRATFSSHCL